MTEQFLNQCPDCGVLGWRDVYRADAHPISCNWMMNSRRCNAGHDEMLMPDEPTCPFPEVDSEAPDAHRRLSRKRPVRFA